MANREEQVYGDWISKINRVEKVVKRKAKLWNKYLNFYRMDDSAFPHDRPGDSVWLNYQFAISRIVLPSIYYKNPDILVSPRGATPYGVARVRELLLNYHLREIDFETEMRKVVFNALFGIGVLKVGFVGEESQSPAMEVQPFESVLEDLFEGKGMLPEEAQKEIDSEYHHSAIKPQLPFAVSLLPRFFLIDEHATCIEDARWVGHRVYKPVSEVKGSKKYPRGLVKGIEGTHSLNDEPFQNEDMDYTVETDRELLSRAPESMVVLYEIWDRQNNELLVLDSWNATAGSRKFLRRETNPYRMDGFPIDILVFNQDPDNPFGVPDAATWYNPTNALNLINSMHYNHIKRFNRKYATKKGALHEEELAKLLSPDDGTIIEVDDENPESCVVPIQDASMSPDVYALREVLRSDLNLISGITEERKGAQGRSKTATEASLMEKQAQLRDSDRLYLVSKFVERSVRRLDQLNQQFLTTDYVNYVTIPEAQMFWMENAPEDVIKAEVSIDVRVGSSSFSSREIRVKQLIDFLNIAGQLQVMDPMTGMPVPVLNIPQVAREIADALNIPNVQEILNPQILQMLNSGQGIAPMPVQPQVGQAPAQDTSRRTGGANLGDMLSGVNNLGVRRTPPNPTNGMAG